MGVSGQPDDPAAWSREPGRPHSQPGRFQTNLSPLSGSEPQIVQPVIALVNAVRSPSTCLQNPRFLWTLYWATSIYSTMSLTSKSRWSDRTTASY